MSHSCAFLPALSTLWRLEFVAFLGCYKLRVVRLRKLCANLRKGTDAGTPEPKRGSLPGAPAWLWLCRTGVGDDSVTSLRRNAADHPNQASTHGATIKSGGRKSNLHQRLPNLTTIRGTRRPATANTPGGAVCARVELQRIAQAECAEPEPLPPCLLNDDDDEKFPSPPPIAHHSPPLSSRRTRPPRPHQQSPRPRPRIRHHLPLRSRACAYTNANISTKPRH